MEKSKSHQRHIYILCFVMCISALAIGLMCSHFVFLYFGKDDGMLARYIMNTTLIFILIKKVTGSKLLSVFGVCVSIILSFLSCLISSHLMLYDLPNGDSDFFPDWIDVFSQTLVACSALIWYALSTSKDK